MKRKLETVGKILFVFVFLSIGFLFAYASYHTTVVALYGENWVTASTTITYTYSARIYDTPIRSGVEGAGSGVEYVLSPTYSFVAADGKTYAGHVYDIFDGDKTDRRTGSEEELRKHLVENGKIYYNPKDPTQSAVEQPFFSLGALFMYALLAILVSFAPILLIIDEVKLFKKHKKQK